MDNGKVLTKSVPVLGVLGGMGPLATFSFCSEIVAHTPADKDSDHLSVLCWNATAIPDRCSAILDTSRESPIPEMKKGVDILVKSGADVIAMPCNTAHAFRETLQKDCPVPFLDMIGETLGYLKRIGVKKFGLLATSGTILIGKYTASDLICVTPTEEEEKIVTDVIYHKIKAGIMPDAHIFDAILTRFRLEGCEKVILGCTELSLLKNQMDRDFVVDAMEVLEYKALSICGKKTIGFPKDFEENNFTGLLPTDDSRKANDTTAFICIKGWKADGHDYAKSAYDNGCRVFYAEKPLSLPSDAIVHYEKDTRKTLAKLACDYYQNPTENMQVIAITGTKGKTTTALFLREILERNGIACGYIGTNGIHYRNVHLDTPNTTPSPLVLQKALWEMERLGVKVCVLEASSQGLMQERLTGIHVSCAVGTNLSPDHIGVGEHKDFDDYFNAKRKLFTDFAPRKVYTYLGKPYMDDLTKGTSRVDLSEIWEKTTNAPAVVGLRLGRTYHSPKGDFFLPMAGECNGENALVALEIAEEIFGISFATGAKNLEKITVDGRSDSVPLPNERWAVIDYAHNRASLTAMLQGLREYNPTALYCLVGTVGGRTKNRRKELSETASELADKIYFTADNPDFEPVEDILSEMMDASPKKEKCLCIADRETAIEKALGELPAGGILLLAGKGQETWQTVKGVKIPFSEREILLKIKNRKMGG